MKREAVVSNQKEEEEQPEGIFIKMNSLGLILKAILGGSGINVPSSVLYDFLS